jgi:Co/Zn/Cd efflux system component
MHLDVQVPGVQSVFDLHVWALKPSIPLLAAHVTVQSGTAAYLLLW